MEAAALILITLLEVPSGALADLIGRKKLVMLGAFLYVMEAIGFALISQPWQVWATNFIWAIGFACCSGTDQAIFYDSLKELNQLQGGDISLESKKQEGLVMSLRFLLLALSSLMTGWLASINLRLPAGVSILGIVIAFGATFFLVEPVSKESFSFKAQLRMIKSGFQTVLGRPQVLWIVFLGVFLGTVSKLWFFAYNPYFELVDLPIEYFGLIFFVLQLIAWFFSWKGYQIERRLGEAGSIILMMTCLAVPIFLMGSLVGILSVGLVLVQNVTRGMLEPFSFAFFNQRVDSENRATVGSVKSFFSGIGQFLGLAGFGLLLEAFSLPASLQILGLTTGVLGTGIYLWYRKIIRNQ